MLDYCWSLYCVGQKKTGINWLASKALPELGTALPQLVLYIFSQLKDLSRSLRCLDVQDSQT